MMHKTLRKLRHDLNKEDAALRPGKKRSVYGFRRIIFSSILLIGAAVLLGAVAIYILHGAGDSRADSPEKNKQEISAEKSTERDADKYEKTPSPASIHNETGGNKTGKKVFVSNPEAVLNEYIPTNRKEAPQEEVIQGKSSLPISKNKKISPNDKIDVRCRPAGSFILSDKQAVKREPAGDFPTALKEKTTSDDKNKKKEKIFEPLYKKNGIEIETGNEKIITAAFDKSSDRQNKTACGLKQGTTLISIHKKGDVVNKSARISSLVARIQTDIRSGNKDKVEKLINRLAILIGAENDYIIKLKSYWYITQEDYESASSLLGAVLKKRKNDLEAGINMAILEIKTGRVDQARKRLQKLRKIYEENTIIPDLLRKIS